MIEACREIVGDRRSMDRETAQEIRTERDAWLNQWSHKLNNQGMPINPYRVIWEFMQTVPPSEAIVTHDSGSPGTS